MTDFTSCDDCAVEDYDICDKCFHQVVSKGDYFQAKKKRWPEVFQPCLCWVTDSGAEEMDNARNCNIAYVDDYIEDDKYPFKSFLSVQWKFAKPLSDDDIQQLKFKVEK